jgi:hypothetical protein
MSVFALENKDTWFAFRKLMQAGSQNYSAGQAVDLLIYG